MAYARASQPFIQRGWTLQRTTMASIHTPATKSQAALSAQALLNSEKLDSPSGASLNCYLSRVKQRSTDLLKYLDTVIWFNLVVVSVTPLVSLYGLFTTPWHYRTAMFCVAYHVLNMIGM